MAEFVGPNVRKQRKMPEMFGPNDAKLFGKWRKNREAMGEISHQSFRRPMLNVVTTCD